MGISLGLQDGDVLMKINGEPFPDIGPELNAFVQKHTDALGSAETISYSVLRENAAGTKEEVVLSAAVMMSKLVLPFLIKFDENATDAQIKLRKAWLEPMN